MNAPIGVVLITTVAAAVASLRWLRVAQREHYLPGGVAVFFWRWTRFDAMNALGFGAALAAIAAALGGILPVALAALIVGSYIVVFPLGLGLKGTTVELRWTGRLRRLAAALGLLWLVPGALALAVPVVAVVGLLALPLLVDAALLLVKRLEHRLGERWVRQAADKIRAVGPRVVAITGSYGKTTTKEYVRQLVGSHLATVASPASFNNRMGLARAVNEHLADGVAVFVAEMGTYGKGEIADLCSWIEPSISVITAIGPVHLERFGSLDNTLAAKAEILERAEVAVLNIDDDRLARLADTVTGRSVVTVSANGDPATVSLVPVGEGFTVMVHGQAVGSIGRVAFPANLACAIGVAVALEVPLDGIAELAEDLRVPQHRQSLYTSEAGFTIIDDTYNSNPAGAAAALARLASLEANRRVVVTPGMVELGPEQAIRNQEFAAAAAGVADDVLIVGRTNRAALQEGTEGGRASVMLMRSRAEAVEWVRANLGPGDAVLYENDLPDHYP